MTTTAIKVEPVDPGSFNAFLDKVLPPNCSLRAETMVYYFMERLCDEYKGGSWGINSLENGGWYMYPTRQEPMHLRWVDNHFDGVLSADAAGIVATLYAINHLANTNELEELCGPYNKLLEFAHQHAEAGSISAAIN